MSIVDHALTRTFRGRGKAAMVKDIALNARQRLAKDIRDVRKLFGNKYDDGIREMLEYAKTLPEFAK